MARRRVPAVLVLYAGQLEPCADLLPTIWCGRRRQGGEVTVLGGERIEDDRRRNCVLTMGLCRRTKVLATDYAWTRKTRTQGLVRKWPAPTFIHSPQLYIFYAKGLIFHLLVNYSPFSLCNEIYRPNYF